jgi:hypothetical protein
MRVSRPASPYNFSDAGRRPGTAAASGAVAEAAVAAALAAASQVAAQPASRVSDVQLTTLSSLRLQLAAAGIPRAATAPGGGRRLTDARNPLSYSTLVESVFVGPEVTTHPARHEREFHPAQRPMELFERLNPHERRQHDAVVSRLTGAETDRIIAQRTARDQRLRDERERQRERHQRMDAASLRSAVFLTHWCRVDGSAL